MLDPTFKRNLKIRQVSRGVYTIGKNPITYTEKEIQTMQDEILGIISKQYAPMSELVKEFAGI